MEVVIAILVAVVATVIATVLSRFAWQQLHRRGGGRQDVEVQLVLSEELANLPVQPRVLVVREGPDTADLLNRPYSFTRCEGYYTVRLDYPLRYGLQFKCFLDWTSNEIKPPNLTKMRAMCEKNGWTHVSADGLHPGRFWFILPEFATKRTDDNEAYINNWFPAGPRAAS